MSDLVVHATGKGPVALFVHGFPLDHSMWAAQTEGLADIATCLAPDLRGFGRSPTGSVGDDEGACVLSMERHADDLVKVMDERGVERVDLIGLSMGGYVALAMCERHPERVRSLTLVDTRANADDAAGKARRDTLAKQV